MHSKAKVMITLISIASVILTAKMAQIQLFSTQYKEQAQKTTLGKNTLYPSRGLIYDRNGELLVSNSTIYDIEVIYSNVASDIDTTAFCSLLNIDKETFVKNINKDWSRLQYHKSSPFIFLSKVSPETFAVFQEHLYKYPGFYPVLRNIRSYPHQNAAHVLGFLGEVNRADIDGGPAGVYSNGDYIGRSGLERTHEVKLRGSKGIAYKLKDVLGRNLESFDNGRLDSSAVAGADIICGLDLKLQQYGEQLMQGKVGSIVAIEPSTGEVLSMVSSPTYDPNLLNLDQDRGRFYDSLSTDTLYRPLFDRSVMAKYPPGSIFKTIFSLIAMEKGTLRSDRTVYCDGIYEVDSKGQYTQACHQHPTPYNVPIALQHSCNSYYYQVFREFIDGYGYRTPNVGLDTLVQHLHDFGLGRKLELDFHIESPGFLPTSQLYDRMYKHVYNGWRSTYILSVGIGQGELQLTTLQMANLAAIIANRGYYYRPHIVKASTVEGVDIDAKYKTRKKVRISPQHFDPVIEGMARVTTVGTGQQAYVPGIEVCGKTGTSQNPHGKDHSVFFAFAPRENPQIALAVYVENAGFGGDIAAPIAGLMIEQYLNDSINSRKKYIEQRILNTSLIKPKPFTQNIVN